METLASDRNLQSHMRSLTVPLGKTRDAMKGFIGGNPDDDFSQFDHSEAITALDVLDI
jgi:hypothetical protein